MKKIDKARRRDVEGRVIIDMTVKDDADFMSPFSAHEDPVIGSDVAEFIEGCLLTVNPKEKLALHIHSDCIDDNEKVVYRDGIHRYYADCLAASASEHRRNVILAIIFALIGLSLLAASIAMGQYGSEIWTEAIDIAAWVFCWEAVDIFAFKDRGLKIDRLRYAALCEIKIEFDEITK